MNKELVLEQKISEAGKLLKSKLPSQFFAEQILSTLALLAEIRRTDLDYPEGILSTDMLLRTGLVSFADLGIKTQPASQCVAVVVWNPRGAESGGLYFNDHRIGVFVSDPPGQNTAGAVVNGSQIALGEADIGSSVLKLRERLTSTFQPVPIKPTIIIAETFTHLV